MVKLKITRATGVAEFPITPRIEVAFESYVKKGLAKALTDDQKMTDVYYLAYLCIKSVEDVPLFGDAFLDSLIQVEVLSDNDPN